MTPGLDEDKVFIVHRGAIITRLDPRFHQALRAYSNLALLHNGQRFKTLITSMFSGGTPNTQNPAYWNGVIPWVSPKDFGAYEINSAADQITQLALNESSAKLAPVKSVLMVVRSGILQHTIPIGVVTSEVAINQDIKAIICNGSCAPHYLATYFRCFQEFILPVITKFGATVQSINTAELNNLLIPLPDKEKQEAIVLIYRSALAKKDQLEAQSKELLCGIDNYLLSELGISLPPDPEKNIDNRIFTAQRKELAGWRFDPDMALYSRHTRTSKFKASKLKEHMRSAPQYGANERGVERLNREVPRYVRITDVNEYGELSPGLGVAAEVAEDKYLLEPGDLLFARSGNTVGKTYLHNSGINEKHVFAGYMIRFRLNAATLLPEYAFSYTLCSAYKDWCRAVQRASGQPNINAEEYKGLLIPVPPLKKQAEIAEKVFLLRHQAQLLREQADMALDEAKRRIEAMLLGKVAV